MGKIIWTILLALSIFMAWYVYDNVAFERSKPNIVLKPVVYSDGKSAIPVEIDDNIGLKSYTVSFVSPNSTQAVASKVYKIATKKDKIIVNIPPSIGQVKQFILRVTAQDTSKWNFGMGNSATMDSKIILDKELPVVELLSNSYGITQGGSALVVFKATDANIKSIFVNTPYGNFKAIPYKKAGYYATLFAWPFDKDEFKADIVVEDEAGGKTTLNIPLIIKNKKYATSYIRASDELIDNKILPIASKDSRFVQMKSKIDKFTAVNEGTRAENEYIIATLGSKLDNKLLADWKIVPFYPLKGGAKVASYGDLRHYYYDIKTKAVISTSDHVGIDLASTQAAPLVSSNAGEVVYDGDNGIYGKMPMINHGMGLYTIYGHCSKVVKPKGSLVKAGDVIANSGTTGLALGDHVHFGVLVQGKEVAPEEWMDSHWIKLNIDDVLEKANMLIK